MITNNNNNDKNIKQLKIISISIENDDVAEHNLTMKRTGSN